MTPIKIQGTIRGYTAWVFERLMEIKGEPMSDVTKYIFDRWVDENAEFLKNFGLTREFFRATEEGRGEVVEIGRR